MVMRKGNYPHQNDSLKHCQRYSGLFCNFDGTPSLFTQHKFQWPVNLSKFTFFPQQPKKTQIKSALKLEYWPLETFYTISNIEYICIILLSIK